MRSSERISTVALVLLALVVGACGGGSSPTDSALLEGVEHLTITSREHTAADVDYPTVPPAGGDHLGIWQNCGIYTVPVLDEAAVHSLEHGAVWVTYRPDVGVDHIVELTELLDGTSRVLVSPHPEQSTPVVVTAWGVRLELDGPDGDRINAFVDAYRDAKTAPEPGVACDRGIGEPPADPHAGLER